MKPFQSKVPTVVKESLGTSLDDALYKKQLPTFLPTAVSEFAIYETLEKNPHILAQTSSQPQSSYKIATSLIEIKLKRVLMDKMTKSQSYLIDDTQKILYDALVTAYKHDKDLFNTYGPTVVLKRAREDDDNQDEDPTTVLNQGLKRRKTSKETETSKKSSTSKDSSKGKFPATSSKSSKSTKEQVEEPIFVKDSDDDTEFDNSWLNDLAKATKPPISFNELMDTPIEFSVFAMNRLKIDNLTKADLVGPIYNMLKGTCKSYVELDYTMEECYGAMSEQLDWSNPEGNRCPYDLSKPLPVQMSQGRQIVQQTSSSTMTWSI
ncbi:hypothetical protein Tco_1226022 [Tanacetum coccineum]